MDAEIERLRGAFFEEASDFLAIIESGLLALEAGSGTAELVHQVFRATHSLKGAARTFEYEDLAGFAHLAEDLLDRVRGGGMLLTPAVAELLLRANDVLHGLLGAARDGTKVPPATAAVSAALRATLTGTPVAAANAAARTVRLTIEPAADALERGHDPGAALRALAGLGTVEETTVHLDALPALDALVPTRCHLRWTVVIRTTAGDDALGAPFTALTTRGGFGVEAVTASAGVPAAPDAVALGRPAGVDANSLRVSTDKVDRLINLVGEVIIAQSMIAHLLEDFTPERMPQLHEALAEMERNTRELHERVMTVRMVPIATVFSRCPRVVRDLATLFGKQIALRTIGGETELDKIVVDQLTDPLMHLIRNSADHGLEPPDERRAAGKPAQGTVTLHAYHQSGKVVIDIQDDGRGLDTDRILAKARAKGLVQDDESLSEDEIHALIFEPGFSTATEVSAVSGRGVGMDVVRRNVESLGGTVTIDSRRGVGTCFRIRLPLTLAIIDGLSLRVGDDVFLLPLVAILESIRPAPSDVETIIGQGELVRLRGECLPLLRLHRLFGLEPRIHDPSQGLVVIVEHEGHRIALLVDELLGQQQVVVKSLETHFRRIEGVGGATILGQGTVALILDVPGLVALSRTTDLHAAGRRSVRARTGEAEPPAPHEVM